ncbi:MAG: nuclear transport factor 2 family protein [Caldilinea sp. CFX5]|nr:nuclear transport factor 2 family protein [Caldilinea sp. CFX5]
MKLEAAAVQIVLAFNDALNAHDVDAMMALMTENCVFENTSPAPDGAHYQGQAAVRAFWEEFFRSSQGQHIMVEEIAAWEDRCVMRWRYQWQSADGQSGYIRGIDLYKLAGGKIAEKLSYVKG